VGVWSSVDAREDGDRMAEPPGPIMAVLLGLEIATPPPLRVLAKLSGRSSARPPIEMHNKLMVEKNSLQH